MYQLTVLLGLLASVTTGVVGFAVPSKTQDGMLYGKRANPNDILGFDCTRIPEVCTNMCYGAFCLTNGESLTYDAPTPQTSKARRTAAGCLPQANRCSTKKGAMPGLNCDEYPFASTALTGGGTATRVNRCVPSGQNSIQGGTIRAFYQNKAYCNGGPCSFNVGFENSGNVMYCDSYSGGGGSCTPDGNEIIGPNNPPAKRSLPDTPMTYKLASGGTIVVPSGAVPGQRVWQLRAHNETLWNEYTQSHVLDEEAGLEQYEYMLANLFFAETTILGYSDSDSEADKVPSE